MKKLMFILALIALAASCTPESITSDEQQLDKDKYEIPPNG
ncbi:MAG: hypothetical protein ACI93N_000415 [Flavobacteriaceae bacterium]|jgi:hypothetical protein